MSHKLDLRDPATVRAQIALVILDLDGTIQDLYQSGPVRAAVRTALAEVQARGIPVTIATGRTLDYVRAQVADLGITLPVVTGQGAVIGDPQTGAVLEEVTIPRETARAAAAWIDARDYVTALYFTAQDAPVQDASTDNGGTIHIYQKGSGATDSGATDSGATIRIYQNRHGTDRAFYDHVFGLPRTLVREFAPLVEQAAAPPLKFIVAEDHARTGYTPDAGRQAQDVEQELRAVLGQGLTITRTHPRLVEGTAPGVDKGAGVRRLCARLGIDPAQVLAIGDSDNDIPMLQTVGLGIGMGNASPGVEAVADWLAPPFDKDGAAVALRHWLLDAPAR